MRSYHPGRGPLTVFGPPRLEPLRKGSSVGLETIGTHRRTSLTPVSGGWEIRQETSVVGSDPGNQGRCTGRDEVRTSYTLVGSTRVCTSTGVHVCECCVWARVRRHRNTTSDLLVYGYLWKHRCVDLCVKVETRVSGGTSTREGVCRCVLRRRGVRTRRCRNV